MTTYAELAVTTNFSFLRGASHPQEMFVTARKLGLSALGIADRNSLAGVVRAYAVWKKIEKRIREEVETGVPPDKRTRNMQLIVGARLVTQDGFDVIAYPMDRDAYGRLCRLLTDGARRARKGDCLIHFEDILHARDGQIFIVMPPDELAGAFIDGVAALAEAAPGRTFLGGVHRHRGDEARRLGILDEWGRTLGAPFVAVNDVHYHAPERRRLADVVTCIREKCVIADAGLRLTVNAERHLKPAAEMARLFADFPEAIARTTDIAAQCAFSLEQLRYEYPEEPVPEGMDENDHLANLVWAGARKRYIEDPILDSIPDKIDKSLRSELKVIKDLKVARYFLTVHDIVQYARGAGILCQGRGSAANSVVCYCLEITEVDPNVIETLFARFISTERGEPPDIDVDFEHERREEVIQYIYRRYGRHRAALCATVIHYRSRRAIREVGKAMGLTDDITTALAKTIWGYGETLPEDYVRQAGLDPTNPVILQAVLLAREIIGFPRHLSQHVGGFVLTQRRLDDTVPISNAAMDDRTVIEWDKDDIDTLGLMKVDVLALGMLSCLRRGFDLLQKHYEDKYRGKNLLTLAAVGKAAADATTDPGMYDMICAAETVGVFQIESRAQMSMLPRLKPRAFYDLVIEVAIVRPGPIQGDMVHPYLTRRERLKEGIEPVYPSPAPPHDKNELKEVLKRTLGVPLFQEQAMQIAITAAGFTPDAADGLRRAMATFRQNGTVHTFREPFISGMRAKGYDPAFAENCFNQIEGFGEYGFPESHAASFALLVIASAWMKHHHPDAFCAAILNSQPMGFYQPAQLVGDARKHGVEVREVDVNYSQWDCTLEATNAKHRRAVRLGFRMVKGLNEGELSKLIAARGNGYRSLERLAASAGVSRFTIERLAEADAFRSIDGMDRRAALWGAQRLGAIGVRKGNRFGAPAASEEEPLPLFAPHMSDDLFDEPTVALASMSLQEHVAEDHFATSLSLKGHPVQFFRERLTRMGALTSAAHRDDGLPQNARILVAGVSLARQMPMTAKGTVFMTLEDETGIVNVIIWKHVLQRYRRTVMTGRFLAVRGRLQRAGLVIHVLADEIVDLTPLMKIADDAGFPAPGAPPAAREADLPLPRSRDFH